MRRQPSPSTRPLCPVCRDDAGLAWSHVSETDADDEHVEEGVLVCKSESCQREYPVIAGVPLLLSDLRTYAANNILPLTERRDISPVLSSLLGDCCGADSAYDTIRRHLSSYAWDHYGDLDPAEFADAFAAPGAVLRQLDAALEAAGKLEGPILDVGCGPARTSLVLAERTGAEVVGIDMFFSALAMAATVVRRGRASYDRRRIGCVYDRREFDVLSPVRDRVSVWCCDAVDLAAEAGRFGAVVALNVLDSVADPMALLRSLAAALKPGGRLVLASPYDWSEGTTTMANWIGGHSQRGPDAGDPATILARLLAGEFHADLGLRVEALRDDVPWAVRNHDRSVTQYRTHIVIASRSTTG